LSRSSTGRKWRVGLHHERKRDPRDEGNRPEIPIRVVAEIANEVAVDDEFTGLSEQERVAVGGSAGDALGSDRSAAAGPVFEVDRLAE
jgi:hypothetical protein